MGLIDSHAHLTFPELRERVDDVLDACRAVGVDAVITIGTDLADAHAAIELADRFASRVHAAVGIHPNEAAKATHDDVEAIAELWKLKVVVACGEMGLDYHYDYSDRTTQRDIFTRQLDLAGGLGKPLIIHCREALDDVVPILEAHGFTGKPVVFHCFTGTADEAKRIAERGWRISFTGVVTFKRSTELQSIARAYPADELMVETDSPYLSPEPVRGKRPNEPAHVAHTARFLADLRSVSFEELAAQTARNTRAFFGL